MIPLFFPFAAALFMALFRTAFLPHVHLMAFAPFLAIVYQRKRFNQAIWIAFGSGIIMDLITSQSRLGLFTINFLLTTFCLYRQKRHFFEDHLFTLSLFTFFISALSTFIQFILLSMFDHPPKCSIRFICTEFMLMPLFDALYAWIWFIGPMKLYQYIKKRGLKTFFFVEKR